MLRESGKFQKMMAVGGQVQQNLPQGRTFQLLRLRIDPALEAVPEISGNRLLVVMRMMRAQEGRLAPIAEDVPFEMSLCA
jgi:cell division protein ZapD